MAIPPSWTGVWISPDPMGHIQAAWRGQPREGPVPEKQHVRLHRDGLQCDYIGKEGKQRIMTVADAAVPPTVLGLAHADNGLTALFCFQDTSAAWHPLHSQDVRPTLPTAPAAISRPRSSGPGTRRC